MKKLFLYASILVATMAFTACTEDYTDWADPQAYSQEDDANAYLATALVKTPSTATIKAEDGAETAKILTTESITNAIDGSIMKFTKLMLGDIEVPITSEFGEMYVSLNDLDAAVKSFYASMASTERELVFTPMGVAMSPDGEAQPARIVTADGANTFTVKYLPAPLPSISETSMVYYVGGYNSWNLGSPTPMEKNEDGTFSVVLEIGDSEWFCFAPQEAVDAQDWNMLFRAQANGDTSTSGFFGDSSTGNSFNCEKGGKYKFTVSPKDWTYSYAPYAEQLWYAGDANGWSFWPLVKVGDHFEGYYYIYLADNASTWGFKFTTTPDWNNPQYGAGDGEGVIAIDGGNCNLPSGNESGFYKLLVNTDNLTFSVEPINQLSLIGSAIGANAWSDDFDLRFNIETMAWEGTYTVNDGEFKIRANHDWSLSWGGSLDAMTSQNGANLPISAGTYKFSFKPNCDGQGVLTIEAQ